MLQKESDFTCLHQCRYSYWQRARIGRISRRWERSHVTELEGIDLSTDLHLPLSPAMRALINSTSSLGMSSSYAFTMSSNIISDASSCFQFLSWGKNPHSLLLYVGGTAICQRKQDSQRTRNVRAIPHVAPWTVTQVMTKSG